jgi:RimJ/RimL family protein N-acetyltransferase
MSGAHSSGALVGRGGLSVAEIDGARRLELGWAVRQELWGRGYATEIGAAGLRYARDALHADEVVALTEVHNRRSRAVMERLGMDYLREIRCPGLVEGAPDVQPDAPFALYVISLS